MLSIQPALISAARRILRPLARLLMARGIDFPAFSEIVKEVFVEVAAEDFPMDDRTLTDSRVSLLSGVHRREVKRIRTLDRRAGGPPPSVSLGAAAVARWCADECFLDAQRRPAPLPRLASHGGERSFERLIESVSKDIRPRAVLEEWLRLGIVRVDDQEYVHLLEAAFIPTAGFDEKAFFLGKGVADHLSAAAHNLGGDKPPFTDRCVYYDGLTEASMRMLMTRSRDLTVGALNEINRLASELQAQDSEAPENAYRITFGSFFYSERERDLKDDQS